MPFSALRAQDIAKETLTRALASGKVHHAYRFEGPEGVGREMAAFALAQALVCTGGDPLGCGECDACRRAVTFSKEPPHSPLHPDVAIVAKGFYPPETIGRSRPELAELSVDQVRTIVLAHAAFPPHEGRARVFIVRRAEELSTGAANALLKTLEEPPQGTYFVLLTSKPDRLLSTIRSRTLPIRFGPLPDDLVRSILAERGVAEDRRDLAIELAGGSASAALDLADPEWIAARDAFVSSVLAAVRAPDLGASIGLGETYGRDKDQLKSDLRALGAVLARTARDRIEADPREATVLAKRYDAVARAITDLERNASPSLTVVSLVGEMRAAVG